jgi:hypothetical protein
MSFYAALESTVMTYVLLDYICQWFIILAEIFYNLGYGLYYW